MSRKETKQVAPASPLEGERSSTGGGDAAVRTLRRGADPDPEVTAGPKRRTFLAGYKLRILEEADRCGQGELGALLRREGLYYSHLEQWRKQRQKGTLAGLARRKRGPKTTSPDRTAISKLQRENEQLKRELHKAHIIIDVQKKVAKMLDELSDQGETI